MSAACLDLDDLFGKTNESLASLICRSQYLIIMFKIGEYREDEAKIIAGYLKNAGFKVDVKGLVVARTDFTASLQGKLSELKGHKEFSPKYERFLAAAKTAVEKASTQDDFQDHFLSELDPNWKEIRSQFNLHADSTEERIEMTSGEIGKTMAEYLLALCFSEDLQNLNNITLGMPIGSSFDDPVISIPAKRNDFDPDDPLHRERMDVDMNKMIARSLEKKGILKMKGNMIKWKA